MTGRTILGAARSGRCSVSMRRAYARLARSRRTSLPTVAVALLAVTVSLAARGGPVVAVVVAGIVTGGVARRHGVPVPLAGALILTVTVLAMLRTDSARESLQPSVTGPYRGWVRLVDDPRPVAGATRVVVEIEGERFEAWIRGRARRIRADAWRGGEYLVASGERTALGAGRADRVGWQHVVGKFDAEWWGDMRPGSPLDRASNRIRSTIERGAAVMPAADGALFRGLVIGDDRDQPPEMTERFRTAGLSHLTAVSGQNIGFLIAAAGPVLRSLRPWWRWAATIGLVAWFVSLTRFEPSIVRAGAMAALSATAFVLGRAADPTRMLAWAVVGLLVVDPLLAGSVGFWLSVGATAGVTVLGPWLTSRWSRLGALAAPLGITCGAQIGVLLPATVVFGGVPATGVPANLLAVPVAGAVMLFGLPAALLAGVVPALAPAVMLPCRIGVRWIDTVALLAGRVGPGPRWLFPVAVVAAVGLGAAKNRGHHGRPPADRRRRVDPARQGPRPRPRTARRR